MVVYPSGIRLPQGQGLKVEQVEKGLFSVENAYEGEYEYFEDRPIAIDVDGKTMKITSVGKIANESNK
jgi:hypothetical protein